MGCTGQKSRINEAANIPITYTSARIQRSSGAMLERPENKGESKTPVVLMWVVLELWQISVNVIDKIEIE